MRKLYLLLLLLTVGPAWGQAGQPDEAHLKGQLWTLTAQRIWQDVPPPRKQAKPAAWDTSEEFRQWTIDTGTKDQSGLVALRAAVVKRMKPLAQQTPTDLAQAIEAEVATVSSYQKLDKEKLKKDFAALLAKPAGAATGTPDTSRQAATLGHHADSLPSAASAPAVGNDVALASLPINEATASGPPPAPSSSWSHWLLLAAVGGLGFGLGAIASWLLWTAQKGKVKKTEPGDAASPFAAASSHKQFKDAEEHVALRNQVKDLQQEKAELTKTIQRLQNQSNTKSTPTDATSVPEPANPQALEATAPPADTALTPSATPLYASAISGGQLDHTRLEAYSMDRLELCIQLDPHNAAKASFILNPGVNLEWLINAGLRRLQDYFDYAEPASSPVSVAKGAAGQLTRQGDTWQVATKARLDVR